MTSNLRARKSVPEDDLTKLGERNLYPNISQGKDAEIVDDRVYRRDTKDSRFLPRHDALYGSEKALKDFRPILIEGKNIRGTHSIANDQLNSQYMKGEFAKLYQRSSHSWEKPEKLTEGIGVKSKLLLA